MYVDLSHDVIATRNICGNVFQFRNNRSTSRLFLRDVCKAVSIERPDLLPQAVPNNFLTDLPPPKIYAFERVGRAATWCKMPPWTLFVTALAPRPCDASGDVT